MVTVASLLPPSQYPVPADSPKFKDSLLAGSTLAWTFSTATVELLEMVTVPSSPDEEKALTPVADESEQSPLAAEPPSQ